MSDNFSNTSTAKTNTFAKGMVKDVTDIYVPEGVWSNAINAINNAHYGETGSIGNEPSNKYCTSAPYTITNVTHIKDTRWVVCSTNNTNSEVGIFDESTCSYSTLANDPCLNFKTTHLITGVCKENYDCTHSFYFQDNLNPDRVLNLDPSRVPYKCEPYTIDVDTTWYEYTVTRTATPPNPCNGSLQVNGGTAPVNPGYFEYPIAIGPNYGLVTLNYQAYDIPDRFVVMYDGVAVIDTGFRGLGGCVPAVGPGAGTATFMKTSLTDIAYLRVYAPCGSTEWKASLSCPDVSAPGVPPMPALTSGISYINKEGKKVDIPYLDYGDSTTVCAKENSVIDSSLDSGYTIGPPGAICKTITETIPDPDHCGEENCTNDLDCDQLRLHPLVTQPCVSVKKAQGAGQLNNGSYQAVVAYSEKGIRLTDYSIPSTVQSLWDHTGIGGALEVSVNNLDQDFEEYELVIISVVNQQTIAKKIGNYSVRQNTVQVDLINAGLPTVDISIIPLRSIIYEKSEKMFNVAGYLIRTGVTTQPYFNYQELANQIQAQWVSVEYPVNYYFHGGNAVGYMRDEVYAFFIRWVYKTGARSASFHIPGREANSTDKLSVTGPDVLYGNETERWQVYDTSTKLVGTGIAKDDGLIISRGLMGYHESTERYPDNMPGVWGDLCGQHIRHHKMPSNETTHIHNNDGDKIHVLGVEFVNIQHPVDDAGNPIADIVGYEILRGSREGNRTIVAKGMFNNMWQYDIKGNSTKKGLYQNYPYNDLRPDKFLSSDYGVLDKGTGNSSTIENAPAPTIYRKDYFSFHSVETNFVKPYLGSNYIKIYTEEKGTVTGSFKVPYKHPKHKIITDGALATSAVIGLGIGLVSAVGRTTVTGGQYPLVAASGSPFGSATRESGGASILTDIPLSAIMQGATGPLAGGGAVSTAAGIALFATQWIFYMGQGMNDVMDIIRKLSSERNYLLQYDSHGVYSSYTNVTNNATPAGVAPSFRRLVNDSGSKYVGSGLQDFNADYRINNLNRNKFVGLNLSTDLPDPVSGIDSTRKRVRDVSDISHGNPFGTFQSETVAYYGALKVDFQNQYGQLQSVVQLPTDSCLYQTDYTAPVKYSTDVLFGGDVYINRYTEKNPYMFFNSWQLGEPDGTEINYRNYVNGPAPRYWVDFNRYDVEDFDISLSGLNLSMSTPSGYHRFDRAGGTGTFALKNVWAYLFCNGVRDFFTESELNMAYRDYGEDDTQKFIDPYGSSFNDLDILFRSDLIKTPIYNKYDLSLSASKLYNNFTSWGAILPRDYNPALYSTCFEYHPKRAVYSLPQQSGLKRDNWKNFLPLNYKDFTGKINNIKSLNTTGAVVLFEDAEPVQFVGVDTLQTTGGVKVTIGDGGLFQQNMQGLVNADDTLGYGTSISSKAVLNTPHGLFWVSQKSGKIMHYSGRVDEISSNGMKFWFAEHLPSKLLEAYPDFPLYDNPVAGIGCQAVYDQQYELIYFSKKDYTPLRDDLHFNDPSGVPYYFCGDDVVLEDTIGEVVEGDSGEVATCVAPIDIAFVLDVTGSMASSINNLKTSIESIVDDLIVKSDNDYRLGLITVNETSGGPANNQILTNFAANNLIAFQTALAPVTAFGGGSIPEPSDLAINQVLDNDLGAFRPDAVKMIILITDAPPSGGNDTYTPGVDDVFAHSLALEAQTKGVKIFTITTGFGVGDTVITAIMTDYAVTSGGIAYNSPTGIVNDSIADAIENAACPLNCQLNVDRLFINAGEVIYLHWTNVSAVSATFTGIGDVPTTGSVMASPKSDITYELVVTSASGETKTCSVDITVTPVTPRCPCAFDDPACFEPCDWTVSYDPKIKAWISFHRWKPSLMIPSHQHFYSIKDNAFWKHNDSFDSYCNYYGQNYPWEIEYPVVTPNNVTTLRSLEYTLDVYRFYNNGQDAHHVLDQNFDRAIVFNSEQISGLLKLNIKGKNAPLDLISFPMINANSIDILFSKEENKYRFNQFWDITKDRGEFTGLTLPMWNTACAGVQKIINPLNVDYAKSALQRKKFRHYGNSIILRKNVSNNNKMVLKLTNSKHLNSSR